MWRKCQCFIVSWPIHADTRARLAGCELRLPSLLVWQGLGHAIQLGAVSESHLFSDISHTLHFYLHCQQYRLGSFLLSKLVQNSGEMDVIYYIPSKLSSSHLKWQKWDLDLGIFIRLSMVAFTKYISACPPFLFPIDITPLQLLYNL